MHERKKAWAIHKLHIDRYGEIVVICGVATTENNRDKILEAFEGEGAAVVEITLDTCTDQQWGAEKFHEQPNW